MLKKNLKTMIITSIVILLPIVFGLVMWDKLPAEMATHFGKDGQADGWSSKPFAVIGLPLFLLVVHWLCVAITSADPKKQNITDKMIMLISWLCPLVSVVGSGATYLYAFDNSINTTKMGLLLLGCIFLVIGNYMPKMKQNYLLGLKVPWTLHSEENWNRTHRMGGYVFMISGIVVFIAAFTELFWLIVVALAMCAFLPMIYSFILYKKGI
jgi:uncharacterized membrane protein